MRFVLLLAALGAAAFVGTSWQIGEPEREQLAVVARVDAGGIVQVDVPEGSGAAASRFFGFALSRGGEASVRSSTPEARNDNSAASAAPVVVVMRPPMPLPVSAQAEVRAAPRDPGAAVVVAQSRESDEARPSLGHIAGDLQRELRRVGCYHGELDGDWGLGSRRALQAFLTRVNSALPTASPDLIQLTLVRGFQGIACRQAEGSIVAARQPASRAEPVTAAPVAVRALQPAAPIASTASAAAGAQAHPAATDQTAAPIEPAPVASAAAALEGRMSVGGPVPGNLPTGAGTEAPIDPALVPPVAKPRPVARAQQRRERSWTATFFNQ